MRYHQVPKELLDAGDTGMFVGGGWFGFDRGTVAVPDAGNFPMFDRWPRCADPDALTGTAQADDQPTQDAHQE